VYKLQITKIIK